MRPMTIDSALFSSSSVDNSHTADPYLKKIKFHNTIPRHYLKFFAKKRVNLIGGLSENC